MAAVLEPSTRKRREWLRWAVLLGVLLLIATPAGVWWLFRERPQPPLTAEEQQFVGRWEPASPIRTASPVETVAHEFRADRNVIYHRHDTRTGARYTEDMGLNWRAGDGQLFYCYLA